jgi:hypothetical protein
MTTTGRVVSLAQSLIVGVFALSVVVVERVERPTEN